MSPWMTRAEVADRLRVPESTLAIWASKGRGPSYAKFGRHCRYRLQDIEAWEEQQITGGVA